MVPTDGTATGTVGSTPTATASPTATATQTERTVEPTTDRPTEQPTTEEDRVELPRGLSEDGIDPVLAANHVYQLSDRSYTLQLRIESASNGWGDTVVRVGDTNGYVRKNNRDIESFFPEQTANLWRSQRENGETLYGNSVLGNERVEDKPIGIRPEEVNKSWFLEALFEAGSFGTPEPLTVDGDRRFAVPFEAFADSEPLANEMGLSAVESPAGVVRVDGDGVVRSMDLDFTGKRGGETEIVEVEQGVSAIGSTGVTEPDWADTARDRAPSVTADSGEDVPAVRIEHQGGQDLPTGTTVKLWDTDGYVGQQRLSDPLSNDDLYVQSVDGTVRLSGSGTVEGAASLNGGSMDVFLAPAATYLQVALPDDL